MKWIVDVNVNANTINTPEENKSKKDFQDRSQKKLWKNNYNLDLIKIKIFWSSKKLISRIHKDILNPTVKYKQHKKCTYDLKTLFAKDICIYVYIHIYVCIFYLNFFSEETSNAPIAPIIGMHHAGESEHKISDTIYITSV